MGAGVFGKLPARRDYVQHGVDPRLMELFDPWLQRSLTESRQALGEGWLDAFLTAPIWRFWLGRRVCGVAALGAMMPSVDGVGRYFPLCVLGAFGDLPPPDEDEQPAWFDAVEALMLAALADGGTYEGLLAGLDALPPPDRARLRADRSELSETFAALRAGTPGELPEGLSCWWVPSPDAENAPRALVRRGLPPPSEYASLIAPEPRPVLAPATGGA